MTHQEAPVQSANSLQVGGNHYKTAYEHWDYVLDFGLGYLEGQVTKYVTRWRKKNGFEDLKKALHYTNKLLENYDRLSKRRVVFSQADIQGATPDRLRLFCQLNGLDQREAAICRTMALWKSKLEIVDVQELILNLMDEADPEQQLEPPPADPVPAEDSNRHAKQHVVKPYECPVCGSTYLTCNRPDCTDGRDPR